MTFQQLVYVMEAAKYLSINKAAQSLFVSQSGISTSLKELEQELGILLFRRTNKGVELTEEGQEFLEHARELVESKNKIQDLYKNKEHSPRALLAVSSQRYPFAEDAFVSFIKKHGEKRYRFQLIETDLDRVIENVHKKRSDIGIIFISNLTENLIRHILRARDLEFRKIVTVQPSAFLREGHPLCGRRSVTLAELNDYPYVRFENDSSERIELSEEVYMLSAHRPDSIISVNDRATAVNVISNTDAVTTGSGLLIADRFHPGMVSIPLDTQDTLQLGWLKELHQPLSRPARGYIEELKVSVKRSIKYTKAIWERNSR